LASCLAWAIFFLWTSKWRWWCASVSADNLRRTFVLLCCCRVEQSAWFTQTLPVSWFQNHFKTFLLLAFDSITTYLLSALYAIARPSVCPSVTRVDQSKLKIVEVRITKFSP